MGTNKNALIRYKVLDNCFRNPGRRYFIEDLIEECTKALAEADPDADGVSRRQIFDDITFMESKEGWSIDLARHKDGKRTFYRYEETSFSINNMPLNDLEINQLKSAISILSQFKGMPQFEWIHELVPKLSHGMASPVIPEAIIEFDSNQYLKGIGHLGALHNAILYKTPLSIRYQPYESPAPFEFTIHPYFLKQYNNRWFLFGHNAELDKSDWNMALDRIVEVREVRVKFHPNHEIDWNQYFDDIIGVTKPEGRQPQKIILHFNSQTGKYMETKPLHGSQRSKWLENGMLELRLEVIPNYELTRLILSYADAVVVIEPKELADQVKERLRNALNNY